MKTNNIFNIQRFVKYFATDCRNWIANFGFTTLIIILLSVITYIIVGLFGLAVSGSWGILKLDFRWTLFFTAMLVVFVHMPVKCYGSITDKKAGSLWLMAPASTLEKFLSMIIICIAGTAMISGLYLMVDHLICILDVRCGLSIFESMQAPLHELSMPGINQEASEIPAELLDRANDFFRQIRNPWLYIDDILMVALIFLLGAVVFRKRKTGKTILSIAVGSIVLSIIAIPIMGTIFKDFRYIASPEEQLLFVLESPICRNISLFDTVSDTIVNLALMVCIYFRLKTIKH